MATRLVPAYPVLLTDYTQAEEDTFAATLTGKSFGWAIIFNTTITPAPGIVRVWNGTAFQSAPAIPPALLALATSSTQGAIPAFGSALQVMRVNSGGTALEFVTLAGGAAWGGITGILANQTDLVAALNLLQVVLSSGVNIKTINGSSVLGAGDLVVAGALPESVYTANIITANTTIPANSSLIVRGRLKVDSGIRLKPALGASIITI